MCKKYVLYKTEERERERERERGVRLRFTCGKTIEALSVKRFGHVEGTGRKEWKSVCIGYTWLVIGEEKGIREGKEKV